MRFETTGRTAARVRRRGKGLGVVMGVLAMVAIGGISWWMLAGAGAATDAPIDGWHPTIDDGFAAAEADGRPVLVMFTADWCPPCRRFKSHVLGNDDVEAVLDRDFVRVKIDLSDRNGPNNAVAADMGVRSIPALHLYDADGYQLDIFNDMHEPGHFLAWLDSNG
jgi:thiol:disulfide interchange protein DsbD